MTALDTTQLNRPQEQNRLEYPDIIIETILHHLGTKKLSPVNITQISATLGYSQHAVHSAASIIKGQHTYFVTERVLDLRTTIDVAFDTISQIITSLQSTLDSRICLADLGLPDVQNALQVVIDVCTSTNWEEGAVPVADVQTFSRETVASSVYCLSSAIEYFMLFASNFAQQVFKSHEITDKNLVSGIEAIVETVFNLIDIVLRGVKEMKGHEKVFDNPDLQKLLFTIGKLTSQRINLIEGFSNETTASFTIIENVTHSNMMHLPLVMDANVAMLLKYILAQEQDIPNFKDNAESIKLLQSNLRDLSNSVHSTHTNPDVAAYSLDISSQNLIATITYLTNSVAALPAELAIIREFHEVIEPNLRANMLYISSSIRTLSDEVILIVQRQLINLICTSSSIDKTDLKKRIVELELSIDSILLMFEKVIKSSIETVRRHMSSILTFDFDVPEYDTEAIILFRDTKQLVSDLDRILNNATSTTSPSTDNAFTICSKSFGETVQSSIKLRSFFKKSIEQINRYLL